MSKLKKGNLVHLYRRKVSGTGILLKRITDVEAFLNLNIENYLTELWSGEQLDWTESQTEIAQLISNFDAVRKDPAKQMIQHIVNHCYKYDFATKTRKKKSSVPNDFSLVIWTQAPSEYTDTSTVYYKNKQVWYPTNWLKIKK